MLARAARRPSTATQAIAAELIKSVLKAAMPTYKQGKISA